MHPKTKKFMYRLRERAEQRAREMEELVTQRLDSLKEDEDAASQNDTPARKGPAWITGRDHREAIGHPKGRIIDLLVGKTQVKSFNQRGERE